MIPELARLVGIGLSYTDFYGNLRTVSGQAVIAMLQALGYPVATDAEAAEAIERIRTADSALQPVYVVQTGEAVALDCGASSGAIEWTLAPEHGVPESGRSERWIRIGRGLDSGYYGLTVNSESSTVIVVPREAYLPPELTERKLWGVAAQVYSLRSADDWGIGDFGDLARLLGITARAGGGCVAINPLHELNLTNPTSASPYAPLSRLHLNALYIDVNAARAMLDAGQAPVADAGVLAALRCTECVQYAAVARTKLAALRGLHAFLRERRERSPHAAAFARFQQEGGTTLRRFATYEALMDEFKRRDPQTWGWMQWPVEYRNPGAPPVAQFAEEHASDVEFYEFLQWLADRQLAGAASGAGAMPIGLYRDLAVGVDANSADVWADPRAFCLDLGVGAPPDPLNVEGQNWSLPPLNPRVLRERAYAPFISLLRANMRCAGALRIDHVMGLMRLFCIPRGMAAVDGTYLGYRFDEMLGVLALESVRARCAIVGEDLGTVPPGFRERLAGKRIFGCRLLYFERDGDGRFRRPEEYTPDAVGSIGTHDVSPLAGFWQGSDLTQRLRLHPESRDAVAKDQEERARARRSLLEMLVSSGTLETAEALRLDEDAEHASDADLWELALAAYRALGRSAARLVLVQLEDALLLRDQVNTPGTFDEVPNWRRRLPIALERLERDPRFASLTSEITAARNETEASLQ
jgi:4-alpha-glucanotransferase